MLVPTLALLTLLAPSQSSAAEPAQCDPQLEAGLLELRSAAEGLGGEIADMPASPRRDRLSAHLRKLQTAAERVQREGCGVTAPSGPPALTDAQMRGLLGALMEERFDDARVELLEAGTVGFCLDSDQAGFLLAQFKTPAGGHEALRRLAPRLLTLERTVPLMRSFKLAQHRKTARAILARAETDAVCRVGDADAAAP